ncbi:MAG: hypothetical protein ACP5N6_09425 [Anaerolineae bacterium]
MFGDWRISLAFGLVGACVAALHIFRLRRESQDRQIWLTDITERQQDRAERREERERRTGRYYRSPEEYKEEGAWY